MYTVLLWGMKETYNRFFNIIKFEEYKQNIEVCGIVSLETYINSIDGYKVIHRNEILELSWDYIVIMATGVNYDEIEEFILKKKIDMEKIIPGEVFGLPGFDFTVYVNIKQSHRPIISDYCVWGGGNIS